MASNFNKKKSLEYLLYQFLIHDPIGKQYKSFVFFDGVPTGAADDMIKIYGIVAMFYSNERNYEGMCFCIFFKMIYPIYPAEKYEGNNTSIGHCKCPDDKPIFDGKKCKKGCPHDGQVESDDGVCACPEGQYLLLDNNDDKKCGACDQPLVFVKSVKSDTIL